MTDRCPKRGNGNIEGATPSITVEQDGTCSCSICGHAWVPKK